jgi:hypothetical protein
VEAWVIGTEAMKRNQPRRKLYDAEAEVVRPSFFMNEKCQKRKPSRLFFEKRSR